MIGGSVVGQLKNSCVYFKLLLYFYSIVVNIICAHNYLNNNKNNNGMFPKRESG